MTPAIADTRVAAGAATGVGESVTTSFMDHLHASNEVRSRLTGVWTVMMETKRGPLGDAHAVSPKEHKSAS
jgi:hypothetical protein